MAGWHHRLSGHEFGWTLGVSDGQGGLASYGSWGHKELDMIERLNWIELNWNCWNIGSSFSGYYFFLPVSPNGPSPHQFHYLINRAAAAAAAKSHQSCPTLRPHRQRPTRFPYPWDSPGKNIGVGCHFLLQCMKVKSESEVAQLCPTLCDPMDCRPPGFSILGSSQARVLENKQSYLMINSNTFCFKILCLRLPWWYSV